MVRLLVLDAFTNGHEAALVFIRKRGWDLADCEIVFCKTHANLLRKLTEGPAFAVVPVRNSIIGEVTEVTEKISELQDSGYELLVRDQLDLQISHCLLAPKHITDAKQLVEVMSHEKAIAQCGRFLDSIGIGPGQRSARDSTGNAAKVVSRLGPDANIGAIAPRAAAAEYGLNILAEAIQDEPDNKTTFILLENLVHVARKVVGIIGISCKFGQMLKRFFEKIGCDVIGSDINEPQGLSNQQVVEMSEAVIFVVPIKDTPSVIRSVLPFVKEHHLLMDVTSVKNPAIEAMLEGKGQVVGLHPMFRPEVPFEGQTVVVCPARLTVAYWKTWMVNVLAATGATIKWSTPLVHDTYMAPVQGNPHFANLASAIMTMELGISAKETLEFTSPFYRIMSAQMGRLIGGNPGLYIDILMENPETLPMLERRIKIEQRLFEMIRDKDRKGLEKLFAKAREHFGEDVIADANELFMRLIGVLNTLYGKNSVILEFTEAQNHPGLLHRISGVFAERKINLAGISYVDLGKGRLQFTICFEQSKSSDGVRRALEEIEKWSDPKVKVLD